MENSKTKHLNSAKGIAGPGRPKGSVSGRTLVLQTLDRILAEQKTQDKIAAFYNEKIDDDLQVFLKDHVYPFIPKEASLKLETDITVLIKQKAQQLVESIGDDFEKSELSEKK